MHKQKPPVFSGGFCLTITAVGMYKVYWKGKYKMLNSWKHFTDFPLLLAVIALLVIVIVAQHFWGRRSGGGDGAG
jgi:hypothetical protein